MLNIAIVGAGFFSQVSHIQNLSKFKVNLKCIADLKDGLREQVAEKFNIKKTYKNHLDLLKYEKNIDGVVIVTNREHMPQIVCDFLNAKIPVLSEKPMCFNSKQAKKMYQIYSKNKTYYQIGYMRNFDLGVIKAKKTLNTLIRSRKYGSLKKVIVKAHDANPYCNEIGYIDPRKFKLIKSKKTKDWKTYPEWINKKLRKDYSDYVNRFCHDINLINNFFNEKPKILFSNISENLFSSTILKYKLFVLNLQTGITNFKERDEIFEFYFENAWLSLSLPHALNKKSPAQVILKIRDKEEKTINYIEDWSWSFENQMRVFLKNIPKKNNYLLSNIKEGLRDIELIENIWKRF